ncbi:MAG: NAD-dependent succinate-semialdehyde dehydrogenase [Geodermatophilaceae bacterium]|nr:NAD-dependent succinate-semialdehyde dehydrogenase [Geodermatophilaceae bacterium]
MTTETIAGLSCPVPTDLLIGGKWVAASGGDRFDVTDPADGSTLCTVADATADDAHAAIDAAYAALPELAAMPPRRRAEILRTAFEMMTERVEDIALLMVRENGKALADAKAEATYAAEFFRWYAEEAVRIDGNFTTAPAGTNKILVTRQPVGVALLITPWNFPAAMATRKWGPAIAAGCPTILKPAAETPLTALLIADILVEAGLPAGAVNVLPSSKAAPLSETALADFRVRKLSFTGSTKVGQGLLKLAADNVVNASMELGGNAPFLVFADADLEAAVEGAMLAKLRNGGEACTAANRFYVEASVADRFAEMLAGKMGAMTMGRGDDDGVQLGPLVNQATVEKVDRLVTEAISGGARALVGGKRPARDGFFYPATVLVDVSDDADCLTEEIFGPVAPIVTFSTEDEAVRKANDTPFGLVAYLYTGDLGRGLRISERLECGMVGINRGVISDPAAPFGGMKQSGIGREGAHDGLLEFLETKYVAFSP